jgi:hypothetical protein
VRAFRLPHRPARPHPSIGRQSGDATSMTALRRHREPASNADHAASSGGGYFLGGVSGYIEEDHRAFEQVATIADRSCVVGSTRTESARRSKAVGVGKRPTTMARIAAATISAYPLRPGRAHCEPGPSPRPSETTPVAITTAWETTFGLGPPAGGAPAGRDGRPGPWPGRLRRDQSATSTPRGPIGHTQAGTSPGVSVRHGWREPRRNIGRIVTPRRFSVGDLYRRLTDDGIIEAKERILGEVRAQNRPAPARSVVERGAGIGGRRPVSPVEPTL